MAEGLGHRDGGIAGLLELADGKKTGPALEADLIRSGLRLRDVGSKKFTWRDLQVFVSEMPRECALFRAMHPELYPWDNGNMLLADIADGINWLVWAKTKDGQKNRKHPQPIPRPGVEAKQVKRTKGEAIPIDQFRQRLDELRARVRVSTKEETVRRVSTRKETEEG